MAAAVKKASNSSISDMQAMQLSANVLAQRFAGNIDDIAGDTAILASASRRLAQIYTDENGELLSTEQVFSRLIKFAREGNKELVDQFGLSNELIAETLGIPNEGLRGAEGAANRWRGMIMVLQEELERLGEPADSLADRYERVFADMQTEIDKLRQATAEPILVTLEYISKGIGNFATGTRGILSIKEAQDLWEQSQNSNNPNLVKTGKAIEEVNMQFARGLMGAPEYMANLIFIIDNYREMEKAAKDAAFEMERLRIVSASVISEDFSYDASGVRSKIRADRVVAGTIPLGQLTEEEQKFRMSVGSNREQMELLEGNLANLVVGTAEWYEVMAKIIGLSGAIADENQQLRDSIRGRVGAYREAQLGVAMAGADIYGQIALLEGFGKTLTEGSLEDLKNQERIAGLQMRLAEENAREWKQTAKEVERMFESAADKIMGIPGITSLTPVTEQEMLAAQYGVYQEQPDEWMRRVRDELLNNVDYANVSREQVAGLTGLSGDLPSDVLINRLEGMWTSGSLFADPANLGLMNMDAIRERYNDMLAGQQGRANQRNYIMSQLGISSADAALLTGQQAPIVQMLTGGMSEGEVGTQLQNSLTGPFGDAISKLDFAQPMISNWTGQLNSEDGQNGLKGLGKIAAAGFFAGFNEGIGSSGFATAIIVAIKTDIAKSLADMANAN